MDIKFLVDGIIAPGSIKPASIVFTKSKLDAVVYSTEVFFEAPLAITLKIENFFKQFSFSDSKDWIQDEEPEIIHSWKKYTGSKTQILTFYKTLGIGLPSLIEGKEPEIREIIDFVFPLSISGIRPDIKTITSIFI